jgi:glycerate dehydrogenase
LDKGTLGADIDLSPIEALWELTAYESTLPEQVAERILDADVVIQNKVRLNAQNLAGAAHLKLICEAATGYDNIDTAYAAARGITLCNVPGYSGESVAQLTVAMALSLVTHLKEYRDFTHSGAYTRSGIANRLEPVFHDVASMKWGVLGGGGIGGRVAEIAQALGCEVMMFRRKQEGPFPLADIDTLCKECDIISIHLPLTEQTRNLINRERIAMMKKGAIIINTARGAETDEQAIAEAILNGHLGGLGCDVYTEEPFTENHPFYRLLDRDNVLLTPHNAWGSVESRARCVATIAKNIQCFFAGNPQNKIV